MHNGKRHRSGPSWVKEPTSVRVWSMCVFLFIKFILQCFSIRMLICFSSLTGIGESGKLELLLKFLLVNDHR